MTNTRELRRDPEDPIPMVEDFVDVADRTAMLYDAGMSRGESTGWSCLDKFWTVLPRQWTVVTGVPGMGKSEWLDALCVNLAEQQGWRFAYYTPENFPTETHVAKILEKRVRKPFYRGPSERMTSSEMSEHMGWVREHFCWLAPDFTNPEFLIEVAAAKRETFGGRAKFGVILDPWNTLEHLRPRDATETEYISRTLTFVTSMVRRYDMHLFIVAHPAKLQRDREGKRPVPTPYDIAGSAHFYNKADNCIAVHRDQTQQGDTHEVEVHVQKVRSKAVGRVGVAVLRYDRVTGRFSDPEADHGGRSPYPPADDEE